MIGWNEMHQAMKKPLPLLLPVPAAALDKRTSSRPLAPSIWDGSSVIISNMPPDIVNPLQSSLQLKSKQTISGIRFPGQQLVNLPCALPTET
jgi:hypothetical protein